MRKPTTNRKPFDPKLPGKYGRMTREELDADIDRYDEPGVAQREADATPQVSHPRHPKPHPGPPPEPVLLRIEPALLKRFDAEAKRHGEARDGMMRRLIHDAIGATKPPAKRPTVRRRRASLQHK